MILSFFRKSEQTEAKVSSYRESRQEALAILKKLRSELYEDNGFKMSPEWSFMLHAESYLEDQDEFAFRKAIGK